MCENPNKNTIRFQLQEQEGFNVWFGRADNFMIDLFVEDDVIFQIDINGYEMRFVPRCESDDECKCYFDEDDEWAEVDCPWGTLEEEFISSGRYLVSLDISRPIPVAQLHKVISEVVHPEFAAPGSIIDAFSFTWVLMDEESGIRTILDGGQIERPSLAYKGSE